jgi:hypothetical protein
MNRRLRAAVAAVAVVVVVVVVGLGGTTGASGRIIEPASNPVKVTFDAHGVPRPFTITVSGFKPNDLVSVEQCDGTAPADPKWVVTTNCDSATVPAQANADARGVVSFPANDPNFGFQPVVGPSPQQLFNCLGPQSNRNNGLPSFATCQVRVATSYLARTTDEVFLALDFGGQPSSTAPPRSGSGNSLGWILAGVAAVVAAGGGVLLALRRRRDPAR